MRGCERTSWLDLYTPRVTSRKFSPRLLRVVSRMRLLLVLSPTLATAYQLFGGAHTPCLRAEPSLRADAARCVASIDNYSHNYYPELPQRQNLTVARAAFSAVSAACHSWRILRKNSIRPGVGFVQRAQTAVKKMRFQLQLREHTLISRLVPENDCDRDGRTSLVRGMPAFRHV